MTTWTLTRAEYEATRERIAKINARAARRGFTGRFEISGTERELTETDEFGFTSTRIVVDVDIDGEEPCYQGWGFLAAVDTIETETGHDFVIRTAPGVEESGVDRSTLAPGRCEHCKTDRPNRKYTYLVRNIDTGETAQVGSTCIKDFTGWAGRPVFISVADVAHEIDEFLGSLGSPAPEYAPHTIVSLAWAISRLYGWVPASGGRSGTKALVFEYLEGRSEAAGELRREVAPEISAAEEKAREIIPALLEGLEGGGDYVTNLRVLLRAPYVEYRHLGIVASAVAAYERMTGETARRKAEALEREQARARAEYIGTKGEKITVTGTVTRLLPVESSFGYTPTASMLIVIQNDVAVVKLFTSAAWAWDVEQGEEITVTGTVKEHEEYRGMKQTALLRPKRVDVPVARDIEKSDR